MIVSRLVAAVRPLSFRGKLRLLDPFVPRSGEHDAELFGSKIKLDLSDDLQRWIYMGTFEPAETRVVSSRLGPGMTFVDIGANVGYFTLLAASRVGPSGRVLAIEPSPWAFRQLERSVAENRLSQVVLSPIGLSDRAGEMALYIPPASSRNHSPTVINWPGSDAVPQTIPVRTLDDHLDERGIDRVDLLKIDVEGHESAVFRGAGRSLDSGRIRAIYCEFNAVALEGAGTSAEELEGLLVGHGFERVPTGKDEKSRQLDMLLFKFKNT